MNDAKIARPPDVATHDGQQHAARGRDERQLEEAAPGVFGEGDATSLLRRRISEQVAELQEEKAAEQRGDRSEDDQPLGRA